MESVLDVWGAVVGVLGLAAAAATELRRRRQVRSLTATAPPAASPAGVDVAAAQRAADRALGWLEHLAWVTAVDARGPSRRALDDLLRLRSTRVEVLDVGERHLLDGAVEHTERALALHDALHDWATLPTRAATPATLHVRDVLGEAVGRLEDDGRLTLDVHPLPAVTADPGLLADALHAVLDNCVRYRWPGRPVHVTVTADESVDGVVGLHLADDGLGVDVDDQERLFLPFTRGDGASAVPGTGLGLAVVARALCAMGGTARFLPHEDRGTTIELVLPTA